MRPSLFCICKARRTGQLQFPPKRFIAECGGAVRGFYTHLVREPGEGIRQGSGHVVSRRVQIVPLCDAKSPDALCVNPRRAPLQPPRELLPFAS